MNILQNPQHSAQIGYNGFDMSKTLKFSSSVGHILPVYYDILNPGDKIDARTILKTRTMPLDAGAFTSIEENIDWFFVPMEQLYHAFSEFYYGVQDFNSDFFDVSSRGFFKRYPFFSLEHLIDDIKLNAHETGYFSSESAVSGALRLLDLFGFPLVQVWRCINSESLANYSFVPVLFQAYNKIYSDYYRLSDREQNVPSTYNVDSYYSDNRISQPFYFLRLHYISWKKDYFTNTQISPIFGMDNPSSVNDFDYSAVNQWLSSTFNLDLIDQNGSTDPSKPTTVGMDSQTIIQDAQSLNVANIRAMFALDKLLEITRRAGKHYDKQTLAHFGIDVPKGISGECNLLHHWNGSIDIGDVIATATSSNSDGSSVLGQVGGKGFANPDRDGDTGFNFTAPAHGVLMAVYYARPVADYYPVFVDKLNTLVESSDWFKPEFDNLGMQPLFAAQTVFNGTDSTPNGNILGWQYRYNELKNKPNTIHGNMAYIDQFKIWSTGKNPLSGTDLNQYLVSPSYCDNLFKVPFNANIAQADLTNQSKFFADLFGSDPLLHQIYFDVRKASKMSTFGLPQL